MDILWEETIGHNGDSDMKSSGQELSRSGATDNEDDHPVLRRGSGLGADWNPVVRSIGAFVGIAFAIVSSPIMLEGYGNTG